MSDGYPFIFQMIDKSESDEYLIQTLQYRFKSAKSHHAYIVRVECYKKHAYCVKFFDKANINSKNKFSLRSNTFEVRTILYTMFHIMPLFARGGQGSRNKTYVMNIEEKSRFHASLQGFMSLIPCNYNSNKKENVKAA